MKSWGVLATAQSIVRARGVTKVGGYLKKKLGMGGFAPTFEKVLKFCHPPFLRGWMRPCIYLVYFVFIYSTIEFVYNGFSRRFKKQSLSTT